MLNEQLLTQIRALEVQLAVLKARCQQRLVDKPKAFADLYGLLKDKVQSTDEDIEASLFKLEWKEAQE